MVFNRIFISLRDPELEQWAIFKNLNSVFNGCINYNLQNLKIMACLDVKNIYGKNNMQFLYVSCEFIISRGLLVSDPKDQHVSKTHQNGPKHSLFMCFHFIIEDLIIIQHFLASKAKILPYFVVSRWSVIFWDRSFFIGFITLNNMNKLVHIFMQLWW